MDERADALHGTVDALPDASPDAPAITGAALQVNDVSILFPLPTSQTARDNDMLTAASAGAHGALLPAAVYEATGGVQSFGGNVSVDELRVVSVRLDPCFAVTSPDPTGAGCEAQLRLVLQPISIYADNSGSHPAFDAAIHTFYRLSRAQVYALVNALVGLRLASTNGEHLGPLAPHPLLVVQGLGGAYGTGLRSLILGAAGADNLSRVATLSTPASAQWDFRIFDVADVSTPTVTARELVTLPAGTTTQTLTSFTSTGPEGTFTPPSSSPDSFNELISVTRASSLSTEERRAQFVGLVRTENPRITTPETVACASCHFAMITKKQIAEPMYGLDEAATGDAFQVDSQIVPVADLRPTFPPSSAAINVHAFGYNGTDVSIIARTVHDSAATVEYFSNAPAP